MIELSSVSICLGPSGGPDCLSGGRGLFLSFFISILFSLSGISGWSMDRVREGRSLVKVVYCLTCVAPEPSEAFCLIKNTKMWRARTEGWYIHMDIG